MPVRVLDGSGSGSNANVTAGFAYACSHGAVIVNASLGGGGYSTADARHDRLGLVREHALRRRGRQRRRRTTTRRRTTRATTARAPDNLPNVDLRRRDRPERRARELLELRPERRPGRARREHPEHLAGVRHALLGGLRGSVRQLDDLHGRGPAVRPFADACRAARTARPIRRPAPTPRTATPGSTARRRWRASRAGSAAACAYNLRLRHAAQSRLLPRLRLRRRASTSAGTSGRARRAARSSLSRPTSPPTTAPPRSSRLCA